MEKDNVSGPKRLRIALVESDDLIRALVAQWLEDAGHTIKRVTVDDLRRGNAIELIIANVPSPRGAAQLTRSLQAIHAAPLLLISARFRRGQGASLQLAKQLGVAAVLPKPFTHEELLTAVARAMADAH